MTYTPPRVRPSPSWRAALEHRQIKRWVPANIANSGATAPTPDVTMAAGIVTSDGAHDVGTAGFGGVGLQRHLWRWWPLSPLLVVSAVALALRLINLGGAALWYDETGSVWMASLPFREMIAATAGDTHPPLYFALLWVWVRLFGSSEFSVRLPSAILSALVVALAFHLALRVGLSRKVAIAAALLTAVAPIQLHYAQEARMYALFEVEFLVTLFAALDRRWWLFGVGLAALYWTHNYGLIYAVPLNAVALRSVLWHERDRRWPALWWLWANIIAGASWLPWLSVLAGQMGAVSGGYWIQPVTVGSVLYAMFRLVWSFAMPPALESHAALLLFGAATWAAYRVLRDRTPGALLMAVLVASPLALVVAASVLWKPLLLPRGLLPTSVPLYLWLAWSVVDGVSLRRALVVGVVAVPVLALAAVTYYTDIGDEKGHPESVVSLIDYKLGDIVYHANEASLMDWHFYTPASWQQFMLFPQGKDLGALSDSTRAAMGYRIAMLDDVPWHRAWLVWSGTPTTTAAEDAQIAAWLATYTHQTIYETESDMSHIAIYLLWNKGVGVP